MLAYISIICLFKETDPEKKTKGREKGYNRQKEPISNYEITHIHSAKHSMIINKAKKKVLS